MRAPALIACCLLTFAAHAQAPQVCFPIDIGLRIRDTLWSNVEHRARATALRHMVENRTATIESLQRDLANAVTVVDRLDSVVTGAYLTRDEAVERQRVAELKAAKAKASARTAWIVVIGEAVLIALIILVP